jgi:hypothetical protein
MQWQNILGTSFARGISALSCHPSGQVLFDPVEKFNGMYNWDGEVLSIVW